MVVVSRSGNDGCVALGSPAPFEKAFGAAEVPYAGGREQMPHGVWLNDVGQVSTEAADPCVIETEDWRPYQQGPDGTMRRSGGVSQWQLTPDPEYRRNLSSDHRESHADVE